MGVSISKIHRRWPVVVALVLAGVTSSLAQMPPTLVRFTPAREHEVRRTVRLPGSVESRTNSVVASEVAGLVIAVDAQEGDRVRKDQPLVRLRPIWFELRMREAEGRLQEAQARLALAQSSLKRVRELFDDEVISQQDLDDAVSEYTAWQGREVQSHAEIAQLNLSLDRLVIRAPFDGVVVRKLTDLGQWIDVGGDVVEMIELDSLDVRIEVPERYFGELAAGVQAAVSFEALPGFELAGSVDAIIPRADPQARTFPIKIRISNSKGRIGVGMLANVDLPIGISYRALIVPKDAVVRQGPMVTVFRIDNGDTVQPLPVETGQGFGSWVVVDGALEAGDRVVTRGNERLQPGQPVNGESLEYPLP
jgi:RND family efflux transporter MFP subunit